MLRPILRVSIALCTALSALILVLALTACGSGGSPESDGGAGSSSSYLYERTVSLTDGRTVTCIVYAEGYTGGLSCDWDGPE